MQVLAGELCGFVVRHGMLASWWWKCLAGFHAKRTASLAAPSKGLVHRLREAENVRIGDGRLEQQTVSLKMHSVLGLPRV